MEEFKIGDIVTYTNDNGCVFPNHIITGIDHNHFLAKYGNIYYLDLDCYWFPVAKTSLTKQNIIT